MELIENLFRWEKIETFFKNSTIQLFEKIRKEIEEHLLDQSEDTDSTDGIFDFLSEFSDKIQSEFACLIDRDSDKKQFLRALTKTFTLLLNTKADTAEKINEILKIAIKTVIKIWSVNDNDLWRVQLRREVERHGKTVYPLKIKLTLPERKTINT